MSLELILLELWHALKRFFCHRASPHAPYRGKYPRSPLACVFYKMLQVRAMTPVQLHKLSTHCALNPLNTGYPYMGTLANSRHPNNPDKMFHQGLYCLQG